MNKVQQLFTLHISLGVIHITGLTIDGSTHNTANIQQNATSDLSSNDFDQYIIGVNCEGCTTETPTEYSSNTNSFEIGGLDSATNYEVWVSVKSISFGQSAVSDSIDIFTRPSMLSGKYLHISFQYGTGDVTIKSYGLHFPMYMNFSVN